MLLERLAKIEGTLAHLIERIEDIETKHAEQNTTVGRFVPNAVLYVLNTGRYWYNLCYLVRDFMLALLFVRGRRPRASTTVTMKNNSAYIKSLI